MRAAMSCVSAGKVVSLARRPVLFALARALGEAWPGDVSQGHADCAGFRSEASPMNRIARGCESKSGGFAARFGCWPR